MGWGVFLVIVASLIGYLAWLTYDGIEGAQRDADQQAETYLSAEIADLQREHERLLEDYTIWDDAWKNLFVKPSPVWIRDNFGQALSNTWGVTRVFLIYNSGLVSEVKDGLLERLAPQHDALAISAQQIAEAARDVSGTDQVYRQVSYFVSTPETVWLLTAGFLSDSSPFTDQQPVKQKPIVVMARPLDDQWLKQIADKAHLSSIAFADSLPLIEDDGVRSVPLPGAENTQAAWIRFKTDMTSLSSLAGMVNLVGAALFMTTLAGLFLHLRSTTVFQTVLHLADQLKEHINLIEDAQDDLQERLEEKEVLADKYKSTAYKKVGLFSAKMGLHIFGTLTVRQDDLIQTADNTLCAAFGYRAGELDGMPLSFLFPGQGGASSYWISDDATSSKAMRILWRDVRISCQDGSIRNVMVLYSAISTAGEDIHLTLHESIIGADAGLALEQFHMLIDQLPSGIIVHDALTPLFANKKFLDMFELNQERLSKMESLAVLLTGPKGDTGSSDEDLSEEERHNAFFDALCLQVSEKKYRMRTKSFPVAWENRAATCTLLLDLTDEYVQYTLREGALNQLEKIIDAAEEGYVRIDNNQLIVEVNQKARDILGYETDEIAGRPIGLFLAEKSRDLIEDNVLLPPNEVHRQYQLEFVDRSGEIIPIDLSVSSLFEADGSLSGCFIFFRDMRKIIAHEQDLIVAREEADKANHAKTAFLSRMSHELRTPLNAIIGFSQLMESSRSEQLSERQREWLDHIHQGGKLLLTLIDGILDLTRMESGELILNVGTVKPSRVIHECLDIVKPLAHQSGVSITATPAVEKLPSVSADIPRFRQAFTNVLDSIVKYNKVGGVITIDAVVEGSNLKILIEDQESGMNEAEREDLSHMLSDVGQGDALVSGVESGLSMASFLIKKMGGHLGLMCDPKSRVTFWIQLPIVS